MAEKDRRPEHQANSNRDDRENRRQDDFGGSLENRARFGLEILRRIKAEVPGFPVIFRMNGDDYMPDGMTAEEALQVAVWAAQAGADALHIAGGHYRSRPDASIMIPPMARPEATFLDHAARVKARIAVKDGRITAIDMDDLTGIGPYSVYPRTSAVECNQILNLVGDLVLATQETVQFIPVNRQKEPAGQTGANLLL